METIPELEEADPVAGERIQANQVATGGFQYELQNGPECIRVLLYQGMMTKPFALQDEAWQENCCQAKNESPYATYGLPSFSIALFAYRTILVVWPHHTDTLRRSLRSSYRCKIQQLDTLGSRSLESLAPAILC